jgi:RimJ/RimL family protein N-acetyltransferase
MNDAEVVRYLESRFISQSLDELYQFVTKHANDQNNIFLAIVLHENQRHIGNIKLGPIDWVHRRGEIGILIGEKDCWRQGYGTEAIRLLIDYAFHTLNLRKLTAGTYAANERSTHAFEKVGFVREGLLKEHSFFDGENIDVIRLGLLRAAT